jgi:stage IV sporulation protein FB
MTAIKYKWNISKIILYPFGGHVVFDEYLNKPIKEELNIVVAGPIFQIILFIIISYLYYLNIINDNTFYLFKNYHYNILFFNLLPIYPLDGSKIINLLLSNKLSFKNNHKLMLYISYITLIFLTFYFFNLNYSLNLLLILFLLISKVILEHKRHPLIFNKFLLERLLKNIYFLNHKLIKNNNLRAMQRNKKHLFLVNKHYISEKEVLKKHFNQ